MEYQLPSESARGVVYVCSPPLVRRSACSAQHLNYSSDEKPVSRLVKSTLPGSSVQS